MTKLRKAIGKLPGRTARLFLFLIISLAFYTLSDDLYLYQSSCEEPAACFEKYKEGGRDLPRGSLALLTLNNTSISFPVMQADDNSYYLDHDSGGADSLSGAIFLDCRAAGDFSDPYSLIYGHHMSSGGMFGSLDAYLDRDYFKDHRTGSLLLEKKEFQLTAFAVCEADAAESILFDCGDDLQRRAGGSLKSCRQKICKAIREDALIYTDPPSSHILALSTCLNETGTMRLMVLFSYSGNTA